MSESEYAKTIPSRRRAACAFCGEIVDTGAAGTYQMTRGWVMVREGGGGHGITLPQRENLFAHGYCLDRVKRGFQTSFFSLL